ncbi:MAG TPA: V-type ATP synthase subunit F [Bryobacteraceae bacterium]|nr:V-type ATP synthase subunit F [Bryobacteraceae bacterium]
MPKEIVVVGDEDAVFGLGLIGLRGYPARTLEEARQVLQSVLAEPATALVLLTENWSAAKDAVPGEGSAPVIEIPCSGPAAARTMSLEETIERALGVRLEGV